MIQDQDFQPFIGLTRDLATEIMQYLSIKQIYSLRCVSKGWRDLLDSPTVYCFFSIFHSFPDLENH